MRISDWISDVCSSDLRKLHGRARRPLRPVRRDAPRLDHRIYPGGGRGARAAPGGGRACPRHGGDRKSAVLGKSVSVSVDLGGRRIIKKNKHNVGRAREYSKLTLQKRRDHNTP